MLPERWVEKNESLRDQIQTPPIEIIDGQHRLLAFEESAGLEGFELPVVAFYGLDTQLAGLSVLDHQYPSEAYQRQPWV